MVYGNNGYVGKHLIVDLLDCKGQVGKLEDRLKELCATTKANIVEGPEFYNFGKAKTGVVVISTSHLRLVKLGNNYHFDLFTCGKEADPNNISPRKPAGKEYWEKGFQPGRIVDYDENKRKQNISAVRRMPGENQEFDYDLEDLANVRSNHLFIDCAEADPEILNDSARLDSLLAELCPKNGSAPKILPHKFDPHGYTAVIVSAAGSSSVHTWPEHRYAALDVFRYDGKPLDIRQILGTISEKIKSPINKMALEPENRNCALPKPEPELATKAA